MEDVLRAEPNFLLTVKVFYLDMTMQNILFPKLSYVNDHRCRVRDRPFEFVTTLYAIPD